jgi:hypothetical protein
VADVNPNGTPQSKLQIFQANATPFQTNFVDQYMNGLAASMGGGGGDPNSNAALAAQLGLSGGQYDANGYRQGTDFDKYFQGHQPETVKVAPAYYQNFLNSPEGQDAINKGKIIEPTAGAGNGAFGTGSNVPGAADKLNQLIAAGATALNTGGKANIADAVKFFQDYPSYDHVPKGRGQAGTRISAATYSQLHDELLKQGYL